MQELIESLAARLKPHGLRISDAHLVEVSMPILAGHGFGESRNNHQILLQVDGKLDPLLETQNWRSIFPKPPGPGEDKPILNLYLPERAPTRHQGRVNHLVELPHPSGILILSGKNKSARDLCKVKRQIQAVHNG